MTLHHNNLQHISTDDVGNNFSRGGTVCQSWLQFTSPFYHPLIHDAGVKVKNGDFMVLKILMLCTMYGLK
jgi:hypothetical protein